MKTTGSRTGRVLQGYFRVERFRAGKVAVAQPKAVPQPGLRAPRPDLLPAKMRTSVGQAKPVRDATPAWRGPRAPELLPGMGPTRMGTRAVAQPRASHGVSTTPVPVGRLRVIGEGRPLEPGIRRTMERFFRADFSAVRVHEGLAAPSLGALAFTLGDELHFAPGSYDPGSREGVELLGHELAHVVQQREGRVANPYGQGVAIVQDPELEAEADRMGQQVAHELWPRARVGPPASLRGVAIQRMDKEQEKQAIVTIPKPTVSKLPPVVLAAIKLARCYNKPRLGDVLAFWLALIKMKRSLFDQLQVVMDIVSTELKLETVDVDTWSATDLTEESHEDKIKTKGSMVDIVGAMVQFVTAARQHAEWYCPEATTRVYLWRDSFYPMVLDSLQPPVAKGDRVTGAMISRTTIGNQYYYNLEDLRPDPSITGMLDAAQQLCGGKRGKLIELLTGFIGTRCKKDSGFDQACDGVIDHLVARRAIVRTIEGFPKQSVLFIDTGYRTFPAFLVALVGFKCGGNVAADMFYCAVDPSFKMLPNLSVGKPDALVSLMNDIGSYGSFFRTGSTLGSNGDLVVTYGTKQRLRDSIVFGILLASIVREMQSL